MLGVYITGNFSRYGSRIKQVWYGMRDHYPEVWEEYIGILPENERGDIITAFDVICRPVSAYGLHTPHANLKPFS